MSEKAPAGWYPHPSMPGTQRYWDGAKWTEHVAPLAPRAEKTSGPGVLTIARGVALGLAGLVAVVWVIVGIATANDDLECAQRNAQLAAAERYGQMEDCG